MMEMSNESKKYPAAATEMMNISRLFGPTMSMACPMISGLIAVVLFTFPSNAPRRDRHRPWTCDRLAYSLPSALTIAAARGI
jgi:hypothetical protein